VLERALVGGCAGGSGSAEREDPGVGASRRPASSEIIVLGEHRVEALFAACLVIRQARQRYGTLDRMIVRSRVPALRLVARLHVDLLRVSSAVCMPAA